MFGVTCKINVDEIGELPSVESMKPLQEQGETGEYFNPYVCFFLKQHVTLLVQ